MRNSFHHHPLFFNDRWPHGTRQPPCSYVCNYVSRYATYTRVINVGSIARNPAHSEASHSRLQSMQDRKPLLGGPVSQSGLPGSHHHCEGLTLTPVYLLVHSATMRELF